MANIAKYISYWGLTPALDLLAEFRKIYPCVMDSEHPTEEFKVLLLGGADCRHILKTVADTKCRRFRRLHFYIIEDDVELYARQLFLLALVFEPPSILSAVDKATMYLEIFGNTLVRPHTSEYVKNKSAELIKIIIEEGLRLYHLPFIDFKEMMFKELDAMESVLKFWKSPNPKVPDISQYWDRRLRSFHGTRYDSRRNLFDYDFSMKLIDRNAEMIGLTKYCNWRATGIAFDRRYGNYVYPNKTICSGDADHYLRHSNSLSYPTGFWGDIVTGPYISFGIRCDNEEYLKKQNGQYVKKSDEISEYNLLDIMSKMEGEISGAEASIQDWLRIHFLSRDHLHRIQHHPDKKFDLVYVSSHMAYSFDPTDVVKLFKGSALLVFETGKFILEWNAGHHTEYEKMIGKKASEIGFVPKETYNSQRHEYAMFVNEN